MASRNPRQKSPVPPPLYGLNDKDEPYNIHDFQSPDMENIEISENVVESRYGCVEHGSDTGVGNVRNAYEFRTSAGQTYFLKQVGGAIRQYNSGTGAWDDVSLPGGYTLSSTAKCCFATLNNLCIICNGEDNDLKYDGSTLTELSDNPIANVQIVFENRLIKFTFSTSRAYYSNINDPETWGALDYEIVDPNNASLGVGLRELNGQIIIFKQNKKYNWTQIVSGSILPLDGTDSAVSHYCIQSTGDSLIFLSPSGWYELRGSTTRHISDHIDITKFDSSRLHNAHAVYYNNKYRCAVTEDGYAYNNLEFVFNLSNPTEFSKNPFAITKNRGMNINCYAKTLSNGQETLYFGDSRPDTGSPASGYPKVYLMFSGYNDDGTAIDAYYNSKLFNDKRPFNIKKYKKDYQRVENNALVTYYWAFRFSTNDAWSEEAIVLPSSDLTWVMDDDSEIEEWDEGYGFPLEGAEDTFNAITNSGRPRTIQFRNRISEEDGRGKWIYHFYEWKLKNKFK